MLKKRTLTLLTAGVAAILIALVWQPANKTGQPEVSGKLREKYSTPNRPSVEIYMRHWQDASFDAYLVTDGIRELLFGSLEYLPDNMSNQVRRVGLVCSTASSSMSGNGDEYDVLWSGDGQRLGIASRGYLVAAAQIKSTFRLRLVRDGMSLGVKETDALLEKFLRGGIVTTRELLKKDLKPKITEE